MDEGARVYLFASFRDTDSLKQAARALALPPERIAVLGSLESGAAQVAADLNVATKLRDDVELDRGQDEQLRWHLANDQRPLLAMVVMAVQGRDVRLRLTQMGAEMLGAPQVNPQENDLAMDPGMASDEPLPTDRRRMTPSLEPSDRDGDE